MPTQTISDLVLDALSDGAELSASAFFAKLVGKGASESELREAVAYLLSGHEIELTPERKLRRSTLIV